MNLDNQIRGPKIIYRHMQSTELFNSQNVLDYCEDRERQVEREIQSIPHSETLSLDRETLFTSLINTYLSDESTDYPVLNIDNVELMRNSDQATVMALYRIPFTGAVGFFTFKPAQEYGHPSTEVTIHLDQVDNEITLYYELPRHDPEENFEERFQALLKNDVAWVVDSLDDVIQHFREHEKNLKGVMGRALEQRTADVDSIEGLMERVDVSEEIFKDKLSVARDPIPSRERHPKYDVFRPRLFASQEGKCKGTGFEIYYSESTVDHIVPQAAGGRDELGNLQVLCTPCNGLKDCGPQDEYIRKIKKDPSRCLGYKP